MNTDDQTIEKNEQPGVQDKPDQTRVKTVTPGNDNGDPGPPSVEIKEDQKDSSHGRK